MTPKQFKSIRNKLGLSPLALGLRLGYKPSTIYAMENGRRAVSKRAEIILRGLQNGK